MTINVFGGGNTGGPAFPLQRSVRLRSSATAYFSRTFGTPTNNLKWTLSGWIKKGGLGTSVSSGDQAFIAAPNGGNADIFFIEDNGTDQFSFFINSVIQARWTPIYRDPSSWYHVVLVYDSANATQANRLLLYINGVQITTLSTAVGISLNQSTTINANAVINRIGNNAINTRCFDGYLTEVNFIDGQALTPSSFGSINSTTGVWQPIKYTSTYGANGFYLNFNDNSAATAAAIGKDSSGNGNNWTPNNISVTAGVTYDSMLDVPTLTSNTNANFATLNPLTIRGATGTLSNANLSVAASSSSSPADTSIYATLNLPSNGLIYLEALYTVTAGSGNDTRIGVSTVGDTGAYVKAGSTTGYWSYDYKNGTANAQGSNTSYTAASTGQTVMFAIDVINGKIWAGANGTWYNSGNPAAGTGAVLTSVSSSATNVQTTLDGWVNRCSLDFNFGQRPFTYTPPTGFKSLNTYNLPDSTIPSGATQFAATTYTGTGSSLAISNTVNGKSFQPDFVWVKGRSGATDHALYDSVRGTTKQLESNSTGAETTEATGLTAFGSSGFTVGALAQMNTNAATYVGWQWKAGGTAVTNTSGSISSQVSANPSAGFSIVTYTGTGANATVGHGLGIAPKMLILKSRSNVRDWPVYHTSVGAGSYLALNTTAASAALSSMWNSTAPTSSYTGTGNTDGQFVYTGFRPRLIITKQTGAISNWSIHDSTRAPYNLTINELYADTSDVEYTGANDSFDLLSNGFKPRSAGTPTNASGGTYIYIAFAENPFKYSLAR